jgi:hypothetical protein
MTTLRQAAKQALEALEFMADEWGFTQKANRPERWQAIEALRAALKQPNADYEHGFVDGMSEQARRSVDKAVNALTQPEPDIYSLPTNKKEPRPGLVNLEEFPGFIYESSNGWHIGDMKVVKWLLNNREADYWAQFKEKS